MKTRILNILKIATILPLIMGVFGFPNATQADWTEIFGGAGSYNNYGYGYDYNQDETVGQHLGDIRLSKRVRREAVDQDYHETTVIRSGELVEVWIEVKNTSNETVTVAVSDQLDGGMVYKANSIRLDGQPTEPGLTSGNFYIEMGPKSVAIITYEVYACSGSGSAIRATAYSPGIGSATDAVIIESEDSYYTNSYYSYESTCMSQFYNSYSSNNSNAGQAGTFGTWTGVNNANAVNNSASNPFGDWTGVNNANSNQPSTVTTTPNSATNNPFADWTGVNNANGSNSNANNPFGDWTGVNNANGYSNGNNSPFGNWTGVNNADSTTNPFGDWTGVNNSNSGYDMRGYSTAGSVNGTRNSNVAGSQTYYVAPTTGVNKTAPLWFAGLVAAAFLLYKKRKFIFN